MITHLRLGDVCFVGSCATSLSLEEVHIVPGCHLKTNRDDRRKLYFQRKSLVDLSLPGYRSHLSLNRGGATRGVVDQDVDVRWLIKVKTR